MKRRSTLIMLGAALVAGTGVGIFLKVGGFSTAAEGRQDPFAARPPGKVVATGLVEGASREAAIKAEIFGRIQTIHAAENTVVHKGDVLVELANDVQKQNLALAVAELAEAKARLEKVVTGARGEERQAAAAAAAASKALFEQSKKEYDRQASLAQISSVSTESVESCYFKMVRFEAEWKKTKAEWDLLDSPARSEDVAIATARVALAESRVQAAEAELAKTWLIAHDGGTVLKILAEQGEVTSPQSSTPLLILADLTKRRVRAFVEELDACRVRAGQKVIVTSDSLPGNQYHGVVTLVLSRMGKDAPKSGAPGEYQDIYYREVVIDLDTQEQLPLNLRVDVAIFTETAFWPMSPE